MEQRVLHLTPHPIPFFRMKRIFKLITECISLKSHPMTEQYIICHSLTNDDILLDLGHISFNSTLRNIWSIQMQFTVSTLSESENLIGK